MLSIGDDHSNGTSLVRNSRERPPRTAHQNLLVATADELGEPTRDSVHIAEPSSLCLDARPPPPRDALNACLNSRAVRGLGPPAPPSARNHPQRPDSG